MSNPADICRECELLQKVQQFEAENAELKAINKDMYEALEEVWRILDSTMPLSRDNRADRIKRILRKARGMAE